MREAGEVRTNDGRAQKQASQLNKKPKRSGAEAEQGSLKTQYVKPARGTGVRSGKVRKKGRQKGKEAEKRRRAECEFGTRAWRRLAETRR